MNFLEALRERRLRQSWLSRQLDGLALKFTPLAQVILAATFIGLSVVAFFSSAALSWLAIPVGICAALLAVFQLISARLLLKRSSRGRSIAVIVDIVSITVLSFLAFQLSNMIALFNAMSQSFFDSFTGLLVVLSGVAWWVVAVRVRKRILGSEDEIAPNEAANRQLKLIGWFKIVGQVLVVIGSIVFLIQFNPLWILFLAISSLFAPNQIGRAHV